jgi:hypothetical protein
MILHREDNLEDKDHLRLKDKDHLRLKDKDRLRLEDNLEVKDHLRLKDDHLHFNVEKFIAEIMVEIKDY